MGTTVELNDTLQITREQGFPSELDFECHLREPLTASDFPNRVFEFHGKQGIRIFQAPPIRVFLVENRDGKWIYWGLIRIIEVLLDYSNQLTSGKFRIIYINTPEEMRIAHSIIDRNPQTDFFSRQR